MPFWDRFVLWVYLGLADTLPAGRDAIGRLFNQAFQPGRLDPAAVNDLSVLLLAAGAAAGSPLRAAAVTQVTRRNLATDYAYVRTLLDGVREPRLTEALEVNRPHQPVTAQLLCNVFTSPPIHEVFANLLEFVARAQLLDPDDRGLRQRVRGCLLDALKRYARIPVGTVDFLSLLYRHALGFLGGYWPVPATWPADPPAWFGAIPDEDERTFLRLFWTALRGPERRLLGLHFHGRLSAERIAGALRYADPAWNADLIVQALEPAWTAVLSEWDTA